ncbi:MAG: hypothetical protein NTV46_19430 [Verrucomicrobia bacterium]|nr:hypothetical protein [Verrucomicrobiota bacterium]
MKTLQLFLVPVAAAFALSGCLQNETTVRVKPDGSGTIVEETFLSAQMMAMLGGLGGLGGDQDKPAKDPLDEMFGQDKAKAKAAKLGDGVTLDKIEKIDKDGKKGARTTYKFADISKLKLLTCYATSGMNEGMGGTPPDAAATEGTPAPETGKKKGDPIRFQMANGKLTITMPRPDITSKDEAKDKAKDKPADETPLSDAADNAQGELMMKTLLADMKIAIRVVAETGIAATDASHVEGNTVTLMEMNFGDVVANPAAMKTLEKLKGKSPDEAAAALKGIKGVKVETKEKISIKMK